MDIIFHLDKFRCQFLQLKDRIFSKKIDVAGIGETLHTILVEKLSISRFGDGEIRLLNNEPIEFQKQDDLLSSRLKEVLHSKLAGHRVCVPDVFRSLNEYHAGEKYFWRKHLAGYRKIWVAHLERGCTYLNTFVTRPYMPFKKFYDRKIYFEKVKMLWDKKDVLIVEGRLTRFGIGNLLLDNCKTIKRILCPPVDAFSRYDEILLKISEHSKDRLVLIALGPTATILAFDLAAGGVQALDIGHLDIEYEWYLRNTPDKVEIPGKYTNEVVYDKSKILSLNDSNYIAQIVAEIK